MTGTDLKSDLKLTTDTPYLTLTGELWGVYCEDFVENWPHYNGTALYPYSMLNTLVHSYIAAIHPCFHTCILLFFNSALCWSNLVSTKGKWSYESHVQSIVWLGASPLLCWVCFSRYITRAPFILNFMAPTANINGLVKGSSISSVSNGDTAVLHKAIDVATNDDKFHILLLNGIV